MIAGKDQKVIKAISLWQPWASLIALGQKQFETRHWTTRYRGPIAIHAAKYQGADARQAFNIPILKAPLLEHGYRHFDDLPFGCIVATAELTEIYATEYIRPSLTPLELQAGNFAPGRFAWKLENVVHLAVAVPCLGRQGLFDWVQP